MSVPAQERVFGRFGPANTLPHFGAMTTRAARFNFGRHTPASSNDMSDTATQHISAQVSRIARASVPKRCVSKEVGHPGPASTGPGPPPTYAEFGYSSSSRALLCSEPRMCTFKIITRTSRINSTPGHCSILRPLLIAPAQIHAEATSLNGADY